ncbi:MAG: hypothetical protein AB7G47_16240 [Mycolicibacterium sp.]|uniref:hypothetical protein n=1 Tax=Mycolicibacterium sp. TaxID=2320850 RepID=UPI003D13BB79
MTNVPAQIVARLTGVSGASIFPLLPPEEPAPPPAPAPSQNPNPVGALTVDPSQGCGDGTTDFVWFVASETCDG